jgi:hypothetical protein
LRALPFRLAFVVAIASMARGDRLVAQHPTPPPNPDTMHVEGSVSPSYLGRLHRVSGPVVISEGSYRVLLAAAPTAATLDAIDAIDTLSRSCGSSARQAGAPSAYSSGGLSLGDARQLVVIVLNVSATRDACAMRWNASAPAIWRSLSLGTGSATGTPVPRALRLVDAGREVRPDRALARPGFELGDGGWRSVASQLRYYYPMSVLAPTASGTSKRLTLEVWDTHGSVSAFEIPPQDVARLQYEYAAWRLASSDAAAHAAHLAPLHPVSPAVRDLLDLAESGKTDEGALRAAELLAVEPLTDSTEHSREVAELLVAEALYQHGDSSAARGLLADIRTRRPCLGAPAGASQALAAGVMSTKRRSCAQVNPLTTLGAGLLVPGGGHLLNGRKVLGALAVAALSGVMANAYAMDATAKRTYDQYERSRDAVETGRLFQRATAQRASAHSRAVLGVALWGTDALIASFVSRVINHEVARGRL